MFKEIFFYIIALLVVLAIWEEFVREKRGKDLKKIVTDYIHSISFLPSFLQRILDYLFNKFTIRQLLNPWFFFSSSILFTWYFTQEISNDLPTIVLLITFFAVMWYARETFALRNEQKKNNALIVENNKLIAGRPLIIIAKELGNVISIKNAGNNIARHIVLEFKINNEQKEKYHFISLGLDQEICYSIPEYLVKTIDNCSPDLVAEVRYYNFQEKDQFETIYKTDASIIVKTGVGRFAQVSDKKL